MAKFKLVYRPLGTIPAHVLTKDDGSELEILTGFGAGLNRWKASKTLGTPAEDLLFGYRSEEQLRTTANDTNAGCRLAPFPGRVAYAQFTWNSNTYKLINNVSWAPHALHGFLQDKPWELASFESDDKEAVAIFKCDWPGAFTGFPFPFRAINEVHFTGDSYSVRTSVENVGKQEMPYSEGWHPYYMLGEKIDGLTMTLPPSDFAEVDSADIPTGKTHDDSRFVQGRKINDEFINDCFCLKDITDGAIAHVLLASKAYTLDIWQKTGKNQFNTIQIYTPPTRENIAIEPMTCVPDALNHHQGLIVLKPGVSNTLEFGAKIQ